MSANNERAKRSDYHPVCEHDGLTWQRSHQEVCLLHTSLYLFCLFISSHMEKTFSLARNMN